MSFTRRQMIQAGSLGIGGLTLPTLLRAEAEGNVATAKSVIFLALAGGPGQHETFDPKPDAPREIRGQYRAIQTRTPGILFSEMLPGLSERTDRFCLLRSMSHSDPVHTTATHTMLTGQPNGAPVDDSPMIGSLVSRFRPSDVALPSHVWLHNMKTGTNKVPRYDSGLSQLGQQHAAMRVGYELDNPASPGFRVKHFDPPEGATDSQLQHRIELLRQLEPLDVESNSLRQYEKFQAKAFELVCGAEARRAFSLDEEPPAIRDSYGRHPLGQYLLMARRLVEAGVRMVTVTGWPGLAPGDSVPQTVQVWDTHDEYYRGHDNMYGVGPYGMKWALPRLDQALSALLDDMTERGLLDDTLVVAVGEFGRTPKFEGEGRGRGHWPHVYSALLAGGGTNPGLVYGSSDSQAAYVSSGRPISHVDFAATVYHALGIPLDTSYGLDGFSLRVNGGTPLTEIFL